MITYRIAAECPCCGAELVRRNNRRTGETFLGCTGYPRCKFTEPYNLHLQHRAVMQPHADGALRQALQHELLEIITVIHPDKWGDHPAATEAAKALNSLRDRLARGVL